MSYSNGILSGTSRETTRRIQRLPYSGFLSQSR